MAKKYGKKKYKKIIANATEAIEEIRKKEKTQITKVKDQALSFSIEILSQLDWDRYWTKERLTNRWQYDQIEQSVTDKSLSVISMNARVKSGVVEDRLGYYEVTGLKCSCSYFVFSGVPCKHMYFLANALIEERKKMGL